MKLRSRVARVNRVVAPLTPLADPEEDDFDYWLARFEGDIRLCVADAEPDFSAAVAAYRVALNTATAARRPPLDPPRGFRPYLTGPARRRRAWQTADRFPAVWVAWGWPAELAMRAADGTPSVSEAEFASLADWHAAHAAGLDIEAVVAALEWPWDRSRMTAGTLAERLAVGPRMVGAGRAAEAVRRLQRVADGELVLDRARPAWESREQYSKLA